MENTEAAVETVEISAPEAVETVAPAVVTRESLKAEGWTKAEMDSAEKRGMIAKADKKDEKAEPAKAEPEAKAAPVVPKSTIPDFTMTPDQEKAFSAAFGEGTPAKGLYFRMKNERQARQFAEGKAKELEARLAALEAPKPVVQVDEMGQPIDPDNQPFTLKAWKEMQRADAEAYQRQAQQQNERGRVISEAHVAQEEYARSVYADFDATVNNAKEVIQNLDSLVPDINDREDIKDLIQKMQVAAANADNISLDQRHAAMIAYRIGKFHPDHGQPPKQTGITDPKGNGPLKAEQMKRIEANNLRRGASAAIPSGGGKRTISADDVDAETLNGMNFKERSSFRAKHPEKYAQLVRG